MVKNLPGFTLIELSIVLVIIGLIVGGVLVGQDLIRSATIRSQITQIEKLNTAVNTFKGKFGSLPGDMGVTDATNFGFAVGSGCDGTYGKHNSNGLIEGAGTGTAQFAGETALFWQDLSSTVAGNLIEGSFGGGSAVCSNPTPPTTTTIMQYVPTAKLGAGNYIFVYSNLGQNWYDISAYTGFR